MRRSARHVAAVGLAAALVVAGGLAAGTSPAQAATDATPGGQQTVSLQLTPRDSALLAATARQAGSLPASIRRSRVATAIAGSGRAAQVAALSRRLGLRVTASTEYAVTVTGSAERVRALFGSARASAPAAATAQPLPTLPGAYGGLVTVANGGDETRPALLPRAVPRKTPAAGQGTAGTLSVAQARSLYGVTATSAPPTATAPIVATLQFSTFATQASDLRAYATRNVLFSPSSYDPNQGLSTVTVTGSCGLSGGGETEVALDQETLLTVAPQLRQRIYLAPNCGDAQDTALQQAATDAGNGLPILALGTSWGSCEAQTYANQAQGTADQNAVNTAEAAGITVFAASGDDGANDCQDGNRQPIARDAVDSPGVVPGVVSVGGTTLTSGGGLTAWNDGSGSSGGGFSCGFFALPSYQSAVARTPSYPRGVSPCTANGANPGSRRQVPDIAADAGDGLAIIENGQLSAVGGTSLAAQLASAGYAQMLAQTGRSRGLGNISSLLYQSGSGLHDVTTGSNGVYAAGAGYDLVTGLGSPDWSRLLSTGTGGHATTGAEGLFTAVTPFRTTGTNPPLGLGAGQSTRVQIAGTGAVPADATGVVVNLTVARATATTFLTAYPTGAARPTTSSVNADAGQVVANLAQLALGPDGSITVFNNRGTTSLDLDVVGYFGSASSAGYTTLSPTRILDTRQGAGPLGAGEVRQLRVAGQGGVPAGATAVVLNLTAVNPTATSYLTAFPDGAAQPFASSLNMLAGQTVPNLVTVGIGTGGIVDIYNNRGSTDVLADVVGYYAPGGGLQFTGLTPGRLVDTRNGTGRAVGQVGQQGSISVPVDYYGVPADAQAVVVQVTAINGTAAGDYVTAYPAGQAVPTASTVNPGRRDTTANLAVVGVGAGNAMGLFNRLGSIDLIGDVVGYYAPTYGDTGLVTTPPTY